MADHQQTNEDLPHGKKLLLDHQPPGDLTCAGSQANQALPPGKKLLQESTQAKDSHLGDREVKSTDPGSTPIEESSPGRGAKTSLEHGHLPFAKKTKPEDQAQGPTDGKPQDETAQASSRPACLPGPHWHTTEVDLRQSRHPQRAAHAFLMRIADHLETTAQKVAWMYWLHAIRTQKGIIRTQDKELGHFKVTTGMKQVFKAEFTKSSLPAHVRAKPEEWKEFGHYRGDELHALPPMEDMMERRVFQTLDQLLDDLVRRHRVDNDDD